MPAKKKSTRPKPPARPVPARFKQFFWSSRTRGLDLDRHRELVVRNILTQGDWDSQKWLRRELGDDALRAWILENEGGPLDSRSLRFWELILKLPKAKVDRWIARIRDLPWERMMAPDDPRWVNESPEKPRRRR